MGGNTKKIKNNPPPTPSNKSFAHFIRSRNIVQCLFIDKWQQKYPHMKFINVAIHADEVGADGKGGTIHAHITYCPVCTSYKKGMSVRNSLTGALKEMGYETDKKKDPTTGEFHFAVEKWQQAMRDELEQMLAVYGYSRLVPEDTRTGHESIADYGKRKDQLRKIEEGQQAVAEGQRQNEKHREELEQREQEARALEERAEEKRQQLNEKLASEKARIDGEDKRLNQREQDLETKASNIEEQREILQAEAEESIIKLKNIIIDTTSKLKETPGKRATEYPPVPLKKGHRAVPEEDLEALVSRSWFSLEHIRGTVEKAVSAFNELPFVKKARSTIQDLEKQIRQLRRQNQKLKEQNQEQQVLLDKAKDFKVDSGITVYEFLKQEIEKANRPKEEHSIADDILK